MNIKVQKQGLYDPRHEHDACGIGAVVHINGHRDHSIVEYGKQILQNLRHRGAAGSDNITGDGAGILFQIPHDHMEVIPIFCFYPFQGKLRGNEFLDPLGFQFCQ